MSDANASKINFDLLLLPIDINDAIPKIKDENNNVVAEGINNFKDCLKSVRNKLYGTIDVLKQELEEKIY